MKLVLTGGPSGGKTTLGMAIVRAFGSRVALVPEAASILFSGGFRRVQYPAGVQHQQKAIYHVQVEHEAIFGHDFADRLLICDRGTIDGLAYWPGCDEKSFYQEIQSSQSAELSRYEWVIHLDTANEADAYNANRNPIRIEDIHSANHINEKVKDAWSKHPQRFILPSTRTFAVKMTMALSIVEEILAGISYGQIAKTVMGG